MGIWDFIHGTVEVEITSAEPEKILSIASNKGIVLYEVFPKGGLKFRAIVLRKDYKKLIHLLSNHGDTIVVLKQRGLYWSLKGLRKRPVLLAGILIYFILVFYVPTRVLFIYVEGNQRVSTWQILDTAQNYGLSFGASRRELRSEKIKNVLLEAIPQLQWVGVNTKGCVATISVLEKNQVKYQMQDNGIKGIFASRDGIIREITVKSGNSLCSVGQAVRRGQLLVSGYTDFGIVMKAEAADAEVYAETTRTYETISPVEFHYRGAEQNTKKYYKLIIGKKLINFFESSSISDTTCVKMYKEYVMMLPGGFRLPVALVVETVKTCELSEHQELRMENFAWVEHHLSRYVQSQMIAGKILNANVTNELRDTVFYLHGNYACYEMISQARNEEITNVYGKAD